MAYTLPLWRPTPDTSTFNISPAPTGFTNPTDAKRYLSGYIPTLPGFNQAWRDYFPAVSRYLEGSLTDVASHMPEGMWSEMAGWFEGLGGTQGMASWGGANPLAPLTEGAAYWMSPEWWKEGQNAVNIYNPKVEMPDLSGGHKQYMMDQIMEKGVMGRTNPGQHSGLGITPAALPQLPDLEQPIQGTLNQWNTMPQWNMGAGPTWGNF